MNSLKTTILLASLTGLLIFVGNIFGGTNGMMIMFIFSLGMNFFTYWYSDKVVLKMYGAKEVSPQEAPDLVRMVANLAQKADMPMPRVCIMQTNIPNAFATGRNPEHGVVAVTTGIMRALNYQELEGVVAHELAHIKNRDTLISTVAASIAGLITMIAHIAQWAAIFGTSRGSDNNEGVGGMVGMIFLIVLAPLAATVIQLALSRSREYQADETGGRMCENPRALASALKKIEAYASQAVMPQATPATASLFIINPLSGAASAMSKLFSTHPATAERVRKLEELALKMR